MGLVDFIFNSDTKNKLKKKPIANRVELVA